MAQTTGATAATDLDVYWSANGSTWTEISGYANAVSDANQTRKVGETYTFDGDTAILGKGKREPIDLKVQIVYAEEAQSAWEALRPYFEAGSAVYFMWAPKGSTAGNYKFTTAAGYISDWPYPSGEADPGDPILIEFTFRTPSVTKGTF